MNKPFGYFQRKTLKALAEALFHTAIANGTMKVSPEQIVENLQVQFGKMRGNKPKEINLTLLLFYAYLGGPFFTSAKNHKKAEIVEKKLRQSPSNLIQDISRLRGIVYAGYYGHWAGETQNSNRHNPVLNSIGYELPAARARPNPQLPDRIERNPQETDLPDSAFVTTPPASAEIIVIGSGAGGAVSAALLAKQGYNVLIVEAGPYFRSQRATDDGSRVPLPDEISHHEADMTARLYVDGALQTTRDNDIVVFQGRCVGGSTVVNNGICLPLHGANEINPHAQDVIATWNKLGAPVDRARWDASAAAIRTHIPIVPMPPRTGKNNGSHLMTGWRAYAADKTDRQTSASPCNWFRKNYGADAVGKVCVSCGYCNTGCPYGRKYATPQIFLQDAVTHGAKILADTPAVAIIRKADPASGKYKATAVRVQTGKNQFRNIAATKGVVVAAGALASSRLLQDSGLETAGYDISLNIAAPMPALMPTELKAWDEDQMATYADPGDFLLESHFQPPMSMAAMMPGWFDDHFNRMLNYNKVASAGILFPADRCGRLVNGKLRFKLRQDVEMPLLRKALATLAEVHFKAGAIEVYPPLRTGYALKPCTRAEIDAFFARHVKEPDDVTLSSSHPHGGNPMHADPKKAIVDPHCRVHGFANLYVTDASVFPSCIRVNAQFTVMTMAHYAMSQPGRFAPPERALPPVV